MKVHVLQHVDFEGIGSIANWLDARGAEITYTRFFESATLPAPQGFDLIIVMGGPMSVNDESEFPWLQLEKEFIRLIVDLEIPLLGICLGAQLIASALGAKVYRNPQKEIGWFDVAAIDSTTSTFTFPDKCKVFHWHGETFDLPSGAVLLAKSAACKNQAFQLGMHVVGLQFHLETTGESVAEMLVDCTGELIPGEYVQSETELRNVPQSYYAEVNCLMEQLLSYLCHKD